MSVKLLNHPKAAPPPPANPANPRPKPGPKPPGGGGIRTKAVTANTLKLANVVNPNRQKAGQPAMEVIRGGTAMDLISGEDIQNGDEINCEVGASGKVTGADSVTSARVDVVSFAEDNPADVEVDWSNVTAVDEYYNGEGFTYEITVDTTATEIILIVG